MRIRPLSLAALGILALPAAASADGIRVTAGGSLSVGVGGEIYVGVGGFAEPPPPIHQECELVDCECDVVYAPAPEPAYYNPPAPETRHDPPPPPSPPSKASRAIGVGLRASRLEMQGGAEVDAAGLLVRFRGPQVELELDLGREEWIHVPGRSTARVGLGVYLNLADPDGSFSPYLLGGLGVAATGTSADDVQNQAYLEGGGGLAWRPSPRVAVTADLRWSTRRLVSDEDDAVPAGATARIPPPGATIDEREGGFEGRLAAILFF